MTGEEPTIKIELSELDAKLFMKFQENYDTFLTLVQSGVFTVKNGNAVIHFDHEGILREITLHTIGYKKGMPIVAILK